MRRRGLCVSFDGPDRDGPTLAHIALLSINASARDARCDFFLYFPSPFRKEGETGGRRDEGRGHKLGDGGRCRAR
ncbi:hypothetical protein BHE74_00009578 [Ensete ventricosum]|nr:hypothetical protein BHE74_00009578 [Ensete ventricosum]